MPGLTTGDAARVLGARLRGADGVVLNGVTCDSRRVRGGELFVALRGARTDGHAHLGDALRRGAAAALVQPDGPPRPAQLPALVVPDTLDALAALARYHAGRLSAHVVGITGSYGKTTAKEFLRVLLAAGGARVHAAPASYNSEVGLPLAVLGAPLDARFLVLEYGINAPGEMEHLVSVARPREAWITALGEAHLAGLGDLAGVVREKGRLARAVPESGHLWLDGATLAVAGDEAAAWVGCRHVVDDPEGDGCTVHARTPGAWEVTHADFGRVRLGLLAGHEVRLALTAARIARRHGVPEERIAATLPRLRAPHGRLQARDAGGVRVLDDAYNASPGSVRAALEVLAAWPGGGRRIAVLGTMHELGDDAEALHREVGAAARRARLDHLITVGEGGRWIAAAAGLPGRPCDDAAHAGRALAAVARAGDVVLLKASRAERLERVLDGLRPAAALQEHAGA